MIDRPILVLLHGHGVDATLWNGFVDAFEADYTVLRSDFSQLTHHQSTDDYADDLLARLDEFGNVPAVLVGHSMGGYVALAFAEKYADRVAGLVLFHSTAYADTDEKKAQREKALEKLAQEGSRAFLEEAIPKMVAEENRARMTDTVQALIDQNGQFPADALQAGIRAMMTRPDRTAVLKNATLPVLIIAGQHDAIVPPDTSRALADLTPHGQFVLLEHSAHLGMLEEPDAALRALRAFLTRLSTT